MTPRPLRTRLPVRSLRLALVFTVWASLSAGPAGAQIHPNHARGFEPQKAYDLSGIENINLFNGNLTLTIPIGQRYPVGGGLSYGLTLVYNGNVWDYELDHLICDGTSEPQTLLVSQPRHTSNAGLGWSLTLGAIHDENNPLNPSGPTYESPDGGMHGLAASLHKDSSQTPGWLYSQDGTYLRYRNSTRELELPDGTIKTFDSDGRLTQIRNRHPDNEVTIQYPTANRWEITDSHNRTHVVKLKWMQSSRSYMVDYVELETFGGTSAKYAFDYEKDENGLEGTEIVRGATNSFAISRCGIPRTIKQPLLVSVSQPDGSQYSMPTATSYDRGPTSGTSITSGHLTGLSLPTGGRMEWDWETRHFPETSVSRVPVQLSDQFATGLNPFRFSAAVSARRHLTTSGSSAGTWRYYAFLEAVGPYNRSKEQMVVEVAPSGHETRHFFSVYHEDKDPNTAEPPGWIHEEYGLPFTRNASDSGRFLSREVYAKQGSSFAIARRHYLRYERDGTSDANPRVASEKTAYLDDGSRWSSVDRSDFDGLGHYRRTVTGGNFASSNFLETYTDYNAGHCATCTPATGSPWVLGTYSYQTVDDGSVVAKTESCFDPGTGFLKRTRRLKLGATSGKQPARSADDVVTVRAPDPDGNPDYDQIFGGDTQTVGTGSLCSLPLPSVAALETNHTYQYGSLRYSQPKYMGFITLNHEIDRSTGKVRRVRDTSLRSTGYEYDAMGRLTWVKPQDDAWTQYVYAAAQGNTPAKVWIYQRPNGGGSALTTDEIRFDGFGRVETERRLMPDGAWAERKSVHTAQGWLSHRTEWNSSARTAYALYDPFGRPGKITLPDGHETLLSYRGERTIDRTVTIGDAYDEATRVVSESPSTTTEIYDRQGRLYRVLEPANADGTTTKTTYTYDVGGRLSRVAQQAKDGNGTLHTQLRKFIYDQRGFLVSEQHPEKTGLVTYGGHDVHGNATERVDGPDELHFGFDRLGRLLSVDEQVGSQARPIKRFVYSNANSSGNFSEGKLVTAERWNYPRLYGAEYEARVTETYTYGGEQGRVSGRETTITFNGTPGEVFTQGWTYDDLGNVSTVTYPRCQFSYCFDEGPIRTISHGRTQGRLTSIPGYVSWIDYHDNGMWSEIQRTNGTYDQQVLQSHAMPRPQSISAKKTVDDALVWSTGRYEYDGAGNVVEMGRSYYLYDPVHRVTSGIQRTYAGGGGTPKPFAFEYDGFGNLTRATTTIDRPIPVDGTTNRLDVSLNPSLDYDSAGRVTAWNGATYEWDAVGMMKRTTNGAQKWLHMYTADDERIWSYQEDAAPRFDRFTLRDLGGKVLRTWEATGYVDWDWTEDHVYRDGTLLASVTPSRTTHLHPDHLGTPRGVSNSAGGRIDYHAYFPYGEEVTGIAQNTQRMKYTGHERDLGDLSSAADDLDYMHARYYNPLTARFLSVDPKARRKALKAPQVWNRYAYAVGNPMKYVDPDGRTAVAVSLDHDLEALANHVPTAEETQQKASIVGTSAAIASLFVPGPEDLVVAGVLATAGARAVASSRVGRFFSKFVDITKGRSIPNRATDVTPSNFGKTLEANGFTRTVSKDGKVTIFTKDNVSYTVRSKSRSTDAPTAEVLVDGKVVQKIRFVEKE